MKKRRRRKGDMSYYDFSRIVQGIVNETLGLLPGRWHVYVDFPRRKSRKGGSAEFLTFKCKASNLLQPMGEFQIFPVRREISDDWVHCHATKVIRECLKLFTAVLQKRDRVTAKKLDEACRSLQGAKVEP